MFEMSLLNAFKSRDGSFNSVRIGRIPSLNKTAVVMRSIKFVTITRL